MTALKEFARLECPGVWRETPEARRRNVVVSFGETSLVIADPSGAALSHWSLAAVVRVNPSERPALFSPSAEAGELLEIADDTMIDAVEKVRRAVVRSRPKGGRLRSLITVAMIAAVAGAVGWWLPDALVRHTISVVPDPTRAEIGSALFKSIARVSGAPCRSPRADRALAQLHTRLLAPRKGGLLVLPEGIDGALALPGGLILVSRTLVEDFDTPDVLAGHILSQDAARTLTDPMANLLTETGLIATVRLLTTGKMEPATLNDYAETLIARPAPTVPAEQLIDRFAAAQVPSTPFAYARDVTGETVLDLIEADPMRGGDAPQILPDGDWVALQQICGG